MKCHKCFQDKIYITKNDEGKTHIKCEICGLDFVGEGDFQGILDLVVFNSDLLETFNEGKKAYEEGIKLNPYFKDVYIGQELPIMRSWQEGWEKGEVEIQNEAFYSSFENLKKETIQLIKEKESLLKDKEETQLKALDLLDIITVLKKKRHFWGSLYRKDLKSFSRKLKEIEEYFKLF